jgi:molecular chaperone DnaK
LLQATKLTTEIALEDAGLNWSQVSRIVLVGGSTHMPAVRKMLKETSGIQPEPGVNPVVAVALGAAIYAQMLETGESFKAIHQKDAAETTSAPAELPASQSSRLKSVVSGSAVERSDRTDSATDGMSRPTVKFVTAHGVGVKVHSKGRSRNEVLIPKNSRVPVKVTRRFITAGDASGSKSVSITITQGDAPDVELIEVLGTGRIGLPVSEAPGNPVDVTMEFDGQGRLHTRATYVKTAQDVAMTLDVRDGLREDEVRAYRDLMQRNGFGHS